MGSTPAAPPPEWVAGEVDHFRARPPDARTGDIPNQERHRVGAASGAQPAHCDTARIHRQDCPARGIGGLVCNVSSLIAGSISRRLWNTATGEITFLAVHVISVPQNRLCQRSQSTPRD